MQKKYKIGEVAARRAEPTDVEVRIKHDKAVATELAPPRAPVRDDAVVAVGELVDGAELLGEARAGTAQAKEADLWARDRPFLHLRGAGPAPACAPREQPAD